MAYYWRIKGPVIFVNENRRTAFQNNLTNFLGQAGIVVLVNGTEEFDDSQGRPGVDLDVCVEDDSQMDDLWDTVINWAKNWIVSMDVWKHRCSTWLGSGPPPDPDPLPIPDVHYTWP